jgi:diadenosine tetraphosphate (Ap4A) HIT family hydrolase
VCWLVFSQLRADHKRQRGSVDEVDNDGCVALLALIAGTVSHLHMHLLADPRAGSAAKYRPERFWLWAAQQAWPPTSRSPSRQRPGG